MVKKIKPVNYIVDDDASIRRAMKRLIRSTGMDVQVFSSAREFLKFKYRRQITGFYDPLIARRGWRQP